MNRRQILLFLTLLITAGASFADVVDDFTVPHGPITLGPGEEPTEDQATDFVPSVLGGFRVMSPVVGEDSAPGSTATARIGGGAFECDLAFTGADEDNGGGCTVAWTADEDGSTFDLTQAGAFEFEVLEAPPGAIVAMFLIDGSVDTSAVISGGVTNGVVAFIENPAPGDYSIPIADFVNPLDPFFDFNTGAVSHVVLVAGYSEGAQGVTRIGALSTTGPIGDGPDKEPPDNPDDPPPDEQLIDFVSGTYFNPDRSGEGCQVTLEGDGVTIILTCYLFLDGAQAWIIGVGTLSNGQVIFDMTLTSGADFGNDFDPDDVMRTPWGTAIMSWSGCNDASIELLPLLAAFEPITLDTTKVIPDDCQGDGADDDTLAFQGTLYDPQRDGEGFQIAAQGETGIYVLTWYTYLDGEQVWLIGTGTRAGSQMVFDDLVITSGADFGADFDPDDVVRTFWGSLMFLFTDCNSGIALITPDPLGQPEFAQFEMPVQKLVPGVCP